MPVHSSPLRNIEQAASVGTLLPTSWFRGHPKTFGNLLPAAFRSRRAERGGYREYWATERFRLRAKSVASAVPEWDDHLRWLLLMQHFGIKTRLLDWTESILVALYFAVCQDAEVDGEVWCIRPDALNNLSGKFLGSLDRPEIRYLAAEAFINETDEPKRHDIARRFQFPKPITLPLAFLPPMEFERMSAQSSRFTIHPYPNGHNAIEQLLADRTQIVRYEIAAEDKQRLKKNLTDLGITRETLFRTLDALAETINDEVYGDDRGDSYPDPPSFS